MRYYPGNHYKKLTERYHRQRIAPLSSILYCCLILSSPPSFPSIRRVSITGAAAAASATDSWVVHRRFLESPSMVTSTTNPKRTTYVVEFLRGGGSRKAGNKMTSRTQSTTNYTASNEADPDSAIGGGAINEKKRTYGDGEADIDPKTTDAQGSPASAFQGTRHRSHLMHALEGLDRYPNYLSRWSNDADLDDLEQALEGRLAQVRQQRQAAQEQHEYLEEIVQRVCQQDSQWASLVEPPHSWKELQDADILDTQTQRAIFQSPYFRSVRSNHTVPTLADVLQGRAKVELDAGQLEDIMDEEAFDVYSFSLLSKPFCAKIRAYMRRIMDELENDEDPEGTKSKDNRPRRAIRNLDNIGLKWLNDLLFQLVVRPISRHLYRDTELSGGSRIEQADLDWRHGFIAAYSAKPNQQQPRQRLVPHTDDAEVTLNVGLGDIFEGGDLQFWGLRGTQDAGKLVGEYTPEAGRALLHAGRQLHEVTSVTSGDRFALIMWTRSWGGVRSTTCPCCWLNGRIGPDSPQAGNCVCGARWN